MPHEIHKYANHQTKISCKCREVNVCCIYKAIYQRHRFFTASLLLLLLAAVAVRKMPRLWR